MYIGKKKRTRFSFHFWGRSDMALFRKAEENDFETIVLLFQNAVENMCSQGIFQWDEIYPAVELLCEDVRRGEMYALVEGDDIVSAVVINDEQSEKYMNVDWEYKNEKPAVLHRLCVNPCFQNRGFGRETVIQAERIIKEADYTAVRLDAFSQNPFALKLYESLGYTRAGEVTFRKGAFFVYEKLLR
jgi:ribosomal protein S18 acetylase RimI-like enzyme